MRYDNLLQGPRRAIGELVGGVAVLATLIYLAVQVRQTRTEVALTGYQARADAAGAILSSHDNSHDLPRIMSKVQFADYGDFGRGHPELVGILGRGRPLRCSVRSMTPELLRYFGAPEGQGILVVQVEAESAAAAAGFEVGDVILSASKEAIDAPHQLRFAIAAAPANATLELEIVRSGEPSTLEVTLRSAPTSPSIARRGARSASTSIRASAGRGGPAEALSRTRAPHA